MAAKPKVSVLRQLDPDILIPPLSAAVALDDLSAVCEALYEAIMGTAKAQGLPLREVMEAALTEVIGPLLDAELTLCKARLPSVEHPQEDVSYALEPLTPQVVDRLQERWGEANRLRRKWEERIRMEVARLKYQRPAKAVVPVREMPPRHLQGTSS